MDTNKTMSQLTPQDLSRFESELQERRRLLVGDFQAIEAGEARGESDVSTTSSTDVGDLSSDCESADVSLGRRSSASDEIQEIDEALQRLRDGMFGLCEACEKTIVRERLEAIPYTRLCMPCKKEEETET